MASRVLDLAMRTYTEAYALVQENRDSPLLCFAVNEDVRLTSLQSGVLLLSEMGVRPTDAADLLGSSSPNVSHAVGELVKLGLIVRVPNERDGRSHVLMATPAGKKVLRRAEENADRAEARTPQGVRLNGTLWSKLVRVRETFRRMR